ncbi:MAG TPA: TlpA disulfide reductase family protein [Bryobacteraceae bacterium]|jgi:thiol-disulfide isomerase/thioredoxin
MLKKLLAITLLAAAALSAKEPRPASTLGIPVPAGKKFHFQDYAGKVVLFVIFSTECKDCIEALNMVNTIQKEYAPHGFQALAAAGDDNAQYLVEPFVQRYKLTFPVGFLTRDEMIKIGDIPLDKRPTAPIFLFIDKRGIVRFQYYGDHPFFKTANGTTHSIIEGLLKEPGGKK